MTTEADIIELERKRLDAMKRGDAALLDTLIDEDFEFFQGDGRYEKKAATIKMIADKTMTYSTLEMSSPRAFVFGDVAAVFHTMDMLSSAYGLKDVRGRRAVAAIWRRRPDGWRLAIYKGVEIPVT